MLRCGTAGSAEFLVIFECRKRKDKDDVTWIEQLTAKARDVRASKLVAVSSAGFSENTKKLTEHEGIELCSVETISDLNGGIGDDSMDLELLKNMLICSMPKFLGAVRMTKPRKNRGMD